MTTLQDRSQANQQDSYRMFERRQHRRHDLEQQQIEIDRWDGKRRYGEPLGHLVDLSAGGLRLRTRQTDVRADQQLRIRLELPAFAGICPFVDTRGDRPEPARHWEGWLAVSRVIPVEDQEVEIAGRLVDMDEMDRGMLGLYLSTQPLAA
jgi:hypothetical protein